MNFGNSGNGLGATQQLGLNPINTPSVSSNSIFGNTSGANFKMPNSTAQPGFGTGNLSSPALGVNNSTPKISFGSTTTTTAQMQGLRIPSTTSTPTFGTGKITSAFGNVSSNSSLVINNPTSTSLGSLQTNFGNSNVTNTTPGIGGVSTNSGFGSGSMGLNTSVFGTVPTTTSATPGLQFVGTKASAPTSAFGSNLLSKTVASATTSGFSNVASAPLLNLTNPNKSNVGSVFGQQTTTSTANTVEQNKGLGGIPTQNSGWINKTDVTKKEGVKNAKDMELQPELKESLTNFEKYISDLKKLREDILKTDELCKLIDRVNEEGKELSDNIGEVANGLQMIQIQSARVRSDLKKEKSNIKISKTKSEHSFNLGSDRNDFIPYLTNKLREFENRISCYNQEIESMESQFFPNNDNNGGIMHSWNYGQQNEITPRELVQIMQKLDIEFLNVAAELYTLTERVRHAKSLHLRKLKAEFSRSSNIGGMRVFQDPFQSVEGRFSDPLFSEFSHTNSLTSNTNTKSSPHHRRTRLSEGVGSSPFEQPNTHSMLMIGGGVSAAVPSGVSGNVGFGNKPAIGGNLFGGLGVTSTSITTPVQFGSGFGATNTSKPASLFGSSTVSSTTTQPTLGFGASSSNINSFGDGSSSAKKPNSLFGSSTNTNAQPAALASTVPNQQQQQQQQSTFQLNKPTNFFGSNNLSNAQTSKINS